MFQIYLSILGRKPNGFWVLNCGSTGLWVPWPFFKADPSTPDSGALPLWHVVTVRTAVVTPFARSESKKIHNSDFQCSQRIPTYPRPLAPLQQVWGTNKGKQYFSLVVIVFLQWKHLISCVFGCICHLKNLRNPFFVFFYFSPQKIEWHFQPQSLMSTCQAILVKILIPEFGEKPEVVPQVTTRLRWSRPKPRTGYRLRRVSS